MNDSCDMSGETDPGDPARLAQGDALTHSLSLQVKRCRATEYAQTAVLR